MNKEGKYMQRIYNGINFQTLNSIRCKNCGGEINNGHCLYCNSKDEDINHELDKLINYINNHSNDDIIITLDNIDFILETLLLEVNNHYEIIDSYIQKQQIYSKIDNFFTSLITKFENNIPISNEEETLLTKILSANIYSPKIIHYIMANILLKKQIVSFETFEHIFKCFAKGLSTDVMNGLNIPETKKINKTKNICFIKEDINVNDKNSIGSYNSKLKEINIKKENIINTYNGKIDGLVIIFHESIHLKQFHAINAGYCTPLLLDQIKEEIISENNSNYYSDNYQYYKLEVEARADSYLYLLDYLNKLELKITEEFSNELKHLINIETKRIQDNSRIFEGNEMQLDEIFKLIIKDHPEYLKKYPQLSIEYIIDNGIVRAKTKEELMEDYLNTKNQNIETIIFNRIQLIKIEEQNNKTL